MILLHRFRYGNVTLGSSEDLRSKFCSDEGESLLSIHEQPNNKASDSLAEGCFRWATDSEVQWAQLISKR